MVDEDLPPEVARDAIRQAAWRMFDERGFAATSMTDISLAAGVDRATLLRYFPTKADLVWYGYDELYGILVDTLRRHRSTGRVGDAIRAALRGILRYDATENDDVAAHLETIDRNPALSAESEDRIAGHKHAIIAFVADEIGQTPDDLTPLLVGETVATAAAVATRHWSNAGDARIALADEVDAAVAPLLEGFAGLLVRPSENP